MLQLVFQKKILENIIQLRVLDETFCGSDHILCGSLRVSMTRLCRSLRVNMTRSVSLEWLLLLNVCKTNTHWPNFRPASLYVGLTLSQRLGWQGWLPVLSHARYAADGSVLRIPITHVRECLPLSEVSLQTWDVHLTLFQCWKQR